MSDPRYDVEAPAGGGAVPPPPARQYRGVYGWNVRSVTKMLRALNGLSALIVVIIYPIAFITSLVSTTNNVHVMLLTGYAILFATFLLCFECNLTPAAMRLRKYFGFLYSYTGRAMYIIFLGTITLAGGTLLGYIVGAWFMVVAVVNLVIITTHPTFSAGGVRGGSTDPSRAYSRGEEDLAHAGKQVVQQNPDLARRAVSAGVSYARDNPEVVQQAVVGAAAQPGGRTSDGFDVGRA